MRHVKRHNQTRRVAIIGTGLMGGSLGLALRCFTSDCEVVAFDRDPRTLNRAHELGVCDEIAASVEDAARGADIIVVAVPLGELEVVLRELAAGDLDENVTVTDLCGAKRLPVRLGESLLGPRFVGGHPMGGSEKTGVGASSADLLRCATWFLTPTARTSDRGVAEVAGLVRSIGGRPFLTDPEGHDRIVASISHLPYVLSVTLLRNVIQRRGSAVVGLGGRSLSEITRIAESDQQVWLPVLRSNRDEIAAALNELTSDLSSLRGILLRDACDELSSWLNEARDALFEDPKTVGETSAGLEPGAGVSPRSPAPGSLVGRA